MPAIRVEGLTKSYSDVRAVAGIDFEIAGGEVVAILGPNGAGKTTTVEILEGFRRPDGGYVEVLENDPANRVPAWLDRIGIVLQDGGMEDELTVSEAIAAQARPYSNPMTTDEAMATVDLVAKRDDRVKNLSGGQRRRLDLALGIVGNPELLFLDEPTTGFDPGARRRSWEAISRLAARGTTVVLTTHYLEEAQELADRVIVMAGGRIVASGSPEELVGTGSTRIRFSIDEIEARTLSLSPVAGRVEIETNDPVRTINDLTRRALDAGIDLVGLEMSRLTLEEAYLELVAGDE